MKLFAIHPGASTSTSDVYNGLVRALVRAEHKVIPFRLDTRIFQAGSWLKWCHKNAVKSGMDVDKPSQADVLYYACGDAVVRALHHECEWLVVVSGMYFPKFFFKIAKRAGLKIAMVMTESPYDDEAQLGIAALSDIVFTHERSSVPVLKHANPNTFYMAHAYDVDIHSLKSQVHEEVNSHDVLFVGTGFQERIDILNAIDWSGIDFGLYGSWTLVGGRSRLRKHIKANEIENELAASLYQKAKIGLNLYRTSKGFGRYTEKIKRAESANLRAYELAACGLFHISGWRPEVEEIFGDLVPTYEDPKQLEELIREYLDKPAERERIALQLPEAVKGHTWDERSGLLVERILAFDNQRARLRVS